MDAEEAGITDVRGAGGLASLSGGGAVVPLAAQGPPPREPASPVSTAAFLDFTFLLLDAASKGK